MMSISADFAKSKLVRPFSTLQELLHAQSPAERSRIAEAKLEPPVENGFSALPLAWAIFTVLHSGKSWESRDTSVFGCFEIVPWLTQSRPSYHEPQK
jgi:hypothetical protein